MNTTGYILLILAFVFLLATLSGLILPKTFGWLFKKGATRPKVAALFVPLMLVAFIAGGIFLALGSPSETATNKQPTIGQVSAKVTLGETSEDVVWSTLFSGAFAEAAIAFADAQSSTDGLLNVDPAVTAKKDWLDDAARILERWQDAESAADRFAAVADQLPEYTVASRTSKRPGFTQPGSTNSNWLVRQAQAQTDNPEVQILNEPITSTFSKAPPGSKGKLAASFFKTDAKNGLLQMQALTDKVAQENYQWAQIFDDAENTASRLETAATIATFFGGLFTGASELALIGSAGKLANLANVVITSFTGASLTMDLGEGLADLGLADKSTSAAFARAKEATFFKVASTLISINDLGKALKNFNKIYGKCFGSDGKLSLDSIKKLMGDQETIDTVKSDGIGNLEVTADWGTSFWNFLTEQPQTVSTVGVDVNQQNVTFDPTQQPLRTNADGVGYGPMHDGSLHKKISDLIATDEPRTEPPPPPAPKKTKRTPEEKAESCRQKGMSYDAGLDGCLSTINVIF